MAHRIPNRTLKTDCLLKSVHYVKIYKFCFLTVPINYSLESEGTATDLLNSSCNLFFTYSLQQKKTESRNAAHSLYQDTYSHGATDKNG